MADIGSETLFRNEYEEKQLDPGKKKFRRTLARQNAEIGRLLGRYLHKRDDNGFFKYANGWSDSKIAKRVGCSTEVVRRIRCEMEMPLRATPSPSGTRKPSSAPILVTNSLSSDVALLLNQRIDHISETAEEALSKAKGAFSVYYKLRDEVAADSKASTKKFSAIARDMSVFGNNFEDMDFNAQELTTKVEKIEQKLDALIKALGGPDKKEQETS